MAYSLWLLLVLIATLLFYIHRRFYTYDRRFMELASKIPGPRRLPFIGSAYVFGLRKKFFVGKFQRILKTNQSVCGVWVGPVLYTIVSNPKDVEAVLNSNKCNEKEEIFYHIMSSILGDGIVISKGEKWKKHRRMLNPIFSLNNLKVFVDIFYLKARETYGLLEGELDRPSFNIYSYSKKCAISALIATIITNDEVGTEFAYKKSIFMDQINNTDDALDYRIIRPWLYFDFIYYKLPCGKQMQSNTKFFQDTILKVADYLKTKTILNEKEKDILESENGITLPRGSYVFLSIYNLHRNPESFPNPKKFDPDNFLPENVAKRSTYAYAPFSHGSRNCIGQKYAMLSIKTQLVVILRRFCVTSTDIEPELHSVITLKPKNGIYVGLQKRKSKEE